MPSTSRDPLPAGEAKVVVDFAYDGKKGKRGKGGTITISVNGNPAAESKLKRTAPIVLDIGEGLDVGEDAGSPVGFTYKLPFEFTGKIEHQRVGTAHRPALSL